MKSAIHRKKNIENDNIIDSDSYKDEKYNDETYNDKTYSDTYTVETALDSYGFGYYQILILILCGSVWAADAAEMTAMAFLLPSIQKDWNLTDFQSGLIGSIVFGGIAAGLYFWGVISDTYGRKYGYLATTLVCSIFGLVSSFSQNYATLIFLRFLVGFGLGGAPVASVLLGEFMPNKYRGSGLTLIELFWTLGVLLEIVIAWFTISAGKSWHLFLFWSCIPLFALLILYFFILESPRYLLRNGKVDEAQNILDNVARINGKPVLKGNLERKIKNPNEHQASFRDLFTPKLWFITLICWTISISATIMYYAIVFLTPFIFGERGNSAFFGMLLSSSAEIPATFFTAFIVDKWGRKKTQIIFYIMFSLCIVIMLLASVDNVKNLLIVALFFTRFSGFAAFATTLVYVQEVYPTRIRSTGLGTNNAVSRIGGIIAPFLNNMAKDHFNGLLIFYASLGIIATICVLQIKETTGKLLDEEEEQEDTEPLLPE